MAQKASLTVSVIQTNASDDPVANLKQATALMQDAWQSDHPDLLVLPECFDFIGGMTGEQQRHAQPAPGGNAYAAMQAFAKKHQIWIHAGSFSEKIDGDDRIYNTSIIFNRQGEEVTRYRKIHLSDITAPDGKQYNESAIYKAGDNIVTYDLEGFKVGCAICYDLRFAELFLELAYRHTDIIILPAAFAVGTGKDHWTVLCRARAIETQTYLVAAGQIGTHHANGEARQTYGHSLICDPWGHVIAQASDSIGFTTSRLKRATLEQARALVPMQSHRRLKPRLI